MDKKEIDTCEIFMRIPTGHLEDPGDGEVTLN